MIRKGREWGTPATGAAEIVVTGDDAALAARVRAHPGARIRFEPAAGSDLARTLGLAPGTRPVDGDAREVAPDVLELDDGRLAVNAVVVGVAPDRMRGWQRRRPVVVEVDGRTVFDGDASGVVIATGQYLRGADLAPRGHPGDGRLEVQVYALEPGPRRAMRARLPTGTHVPHPGISEASGRTVVVTPGRAWPLEADGRPLGAVGRLGVAVRPGAYRLVL